jgi:hypothetical protein
VYIIIENSEFMKRDEKFNKESVDKVYKECSENPYIPAACFALKLEASARYMTVVLNELVESGEYEFIKVGNTFHFRPVKKQFTSPPPSQ